MAVSFHVGADLGVPSERWGVIPSIGDAEITSMDTPRRAEVGEEEPQQVECHAECEVRRKPRYLARLRYLPRSFRPRTTRLT